MTMFENENPIMPLADDGSGGSTSKMLDFPILKQSDYETSSNPNTHCAATCYLAIANYFDVNIDMSDLWGTVVNRNTGEVSTWNNHFSSTGPTSYSYNAVIRAVDQGHPVLLRGSSTMPMHFAVACGYGPNGLKVMDPYDGRIDYLGNTALNNPPLKYWICSKK